MSQSIPHNIVIRAATPDQQSRALSLVFSGEEHEDPAAQVAAALAAANDDEHALDGLLVACRGREVVGAIWGQTMPGRTAVVWPPRLVEDESQETAEALLRSLDEHLSSRNVRMAQAVLMSHDGLDATCLRDGGYQHAADLLYLASERSQFPDSPPSSPLDFHPYQPSDQPRLAALIEQTYEGTRDCPSLNGVRDTQDVLEGYRQTGQSGWRHWLLVQHEHRDVGCLLLADHTEHDQWELVYMGVLPAARGRGWGVEITRYGQWLTLCAGKQRLVLAVDAANEPAIAMYVTAGFAECARRSVWLKIL
jgi:mycothiol synthase